MRIQGFPYKYIVAMESRGFSEAPLVIIEALNHITWAGKEAVKDSSFNPFNEMLTVGYMEKQEMRVSSQTGGRVTVSGRY